MHFPPSNVLLPRLTEPRTLLSTMTVLGTPGEVFLLTHSALRARIGLPTTARVERIEPNGALVRVMVPEVASGPSASLTTGLSSVSTRPGSRAATA